MIGFRLLGIVGTFLLLVSVSRVQWNFWCTNALCYCCSINVSLFAWWTGNISPYFMIYIFKGLWKRDFYYVCNLLKKKNEVILRPFSIQNTKIYTIFNTKGNVFSIFLNFFHLQSIYIKFIPTLKNIWSYQQILWQ